jgi:hypothetical protein
LYVNAIERMPPPAPEMAWMAASEEAILGCLTDVKGCERRRAHTHIKSRNPKRMDFLVKVKGES